MGEAGLAKRGASLEIVAVFDQFVFKFVVWGLIGLELVMQCCFFILIKYLNMLLNCYCIRL